MLNNLPKITDRKKKRLGQGYGSGKGGHTVGRGAKGDKARGKTPQFFAGTKGKKSFVKRLLFWRGKGKQKPRFPKSKIINLQLVEKHFQSDQTVSRKTLITKGLLRPSYSKQRVK